MNAMIKKRGPGRPPAKKYFSGEELREQAAARLKERADSEFLPIDPKARADALEEICELDFATMTKRELRHLHQVFEAVYSSYLDDLAALKDLEAKSCPSSKTYVGVAAAIEEGVTVGTGMMSPEDWCETHRLRPNGHRKPGPLPKQKPNIFDITAGTKGLAEKKYEPVHKMPQETKEGYLVRRELEIEVQKSMQQPPRLVGKRVNRNPIPNQRLDKTLRKADRERQAGETDINKEI